MKRGKLYGTFSCIAISGLILAGCGTSGSASVKGNVTAAASGASKLVIGVSGDALKLDPQTTADLTSANVFMNIFDNLVTQSSTGKIVPMIATSWNTQGNNWIFNLRKDVKFSNGDPLDATVVQQSFARLLDPKTAAPRASLFKDVKDIKVLGKYQIEFEMKEPFAPLLANLSNYAGGIVDPKVVKAEGKSSTVASLLVQDHLSWCHGSQTTNSP